MTEETKRRWKIVLTVLIIAIVIAVLYFYLQRNGLIEFFSSKDKIQEYVASFGIWAPLAFMALQIIQVIIAPIPGNVTTIAGGLLFGFWVSSAISVVAILIGSFICFWLAKSYGRPLVVKLVKEETVDKYLKEMSSRQRIALILLFLFPFFPDDALCLIAGLTPIKTKHFMILVLFTRPWGVIGSALIGASVISIPLWGWIIIAIGSITVFAVAMKYGPAIEEKIKIWYRKLKKSV